MGIVTPQQLGVGVSGGIEVKVWGLELLYEKNMALGKPSCGRGSRHLERTQHV
jgi:hypothetical protein